MRRLAIVLAFLIAPLVALLTAAAPRAPAANEAGEFAYYVLALSWNAAWCRVEGDARRAEQCDPRHDIGFVLHGLWPQHEDGWPEYCATEHRDPAPADAAGMADIMGSDALAWHAWQKHGRCSGLGPEGYYALSRRAFEAIRRPEMLRDVDDPLRLAPQVVEGAFLEANPALSPAAVTVTCRDGLFREVRICLDRDLAPRPCTGPAARQCPLGSVLFLPMR